MAYVMSSLTLTFARGSVRLEFEVHGTRACVTARGIRAVRVVITVVVSRAFVHV